MSNKTFGLLAVAAFVAMFVCLVAGLAAMGAVTKAMTPPPTPEELAAQAVRAKAEERAALFDPFPPCYAAQDTLRDRLKNPKSASFLYSCVDDRFVQFTKDGQEARVKPAIVPGFSFFP
jgi:hypothetical protein